ncbi:MULTISPECIES: PepSY domain-containing protein [unclassified Achromobacter]|uniref:PepSY domain-containing protein n=1 Tax=unclassified Achromobacter TaxID=2626865 RepID=UPI00069CF0A5|nr:MULTISPECIES: PepSY domain-containing protein [unclassified Achromobacter]KOF54389.1 peptidase [Achromobacter sp. DMS1]
MPLRSCLAILLSCATLVGPSPARADDDHDRAREALQEGKILPLRTVLDIVERSYPGQVVKVEFEEDDGEYLYEIRLLQASGNLLKLKIDARDGRVLGVKGKHMQFRDDD